MYFCIVLHKENSALIQMRLLFLQIVSNLVQYLGTLFIVLCSLISKEIDVEYTAFILKNCCMTSLTTDPSWPSSPLSRQLLRIRIIAVNPCLIDGYEIDGTVLTGPFLFCKLKGRNFQNDRFNELPCCFFSHLYQNTHVCFTFFFTLHLSSSTTA